MMTSKSGFRGIIGVAILLAVQSGIPSALLATPTAINKTQDLQFGKFAAGSGIAGTVRIDTSGRRFPSGGVILLASSFSPAGFTITGNAGDSYTLTLPVTFTISSDADQINVSSVTSSIPSAGVLPVSGTLPFTVGGTLTVISTQQNSTYSGSMDVSVK